MIEYVYLWKIADFQFVYNLRRLFHEAYQDFNYQRSQGVHEEGRMRRVPDFLPVSLQDLLHRW